MIQINGPVNLHGVDLVANDLRSAAAQIVAALGAKGDSTLAGTHHLFRGYSDLVGQFKQLGARIEEINL